MSTVIAVYKAKAEGLEPLLREHEGVLRAEGLLGPAPAVTLRAPGGFYLEIVEWKNPEAAARAHENTRVLAHWEKLGAVAQFTSLSELPAECLAVPFAKFQPL
jgi:hypothetical protein